MVKINLEICVGCGACAADCLGKKIEITDKRAVVKEPCLQCGHCVAVCPVNAVSIPEYDMADVEEWPVGEMNLSAETLLRTMKFRRSIRKYTKETVSPEKLEKLVQAGRYAATAKNLQDCHFVIVQKNLSRLKELVWNHIDRITAVPGGMDQNLLPYAEFNERRKKDPADDYLFRNAPAVIYIFSERGWDAGMAAQNMELMAVAEGMGVLYNGFLARISDRNTELKEWFGLSGKPVAACMLVGFPEVTYRRTAPRRAANVRLL